MKIPEFFQDWYDSINIPVHESNNSSHEHVKIQQGVEKALIQAREENIPVVSISADLASSTGVKAFQQKYPSDTFDAGVSESNMVSMASGFSKLGYISIIDTFAQFGISKGFLPIVMANLSQAPIIAIFSHTGFQDAADGASHQATQYLSAFSNMPSTIVVNLSCAQSAHEYIYQGIKYQYEKKKQNLVPESIIFFLGRENFPKNYGQIHYQFFKNNLLYKPENIKEISYLLITTGSMVLNGLKIRETLWNTYQKNGVVIEIPFIHTSQDNKDYALVQEYFNSMENPVLVILEDHQIYGGLGARLTQDIHRFNLGLKSNNKNPKFLYLGIDGKFGKSAYCANDLYKEYGFGIEESVKKIVEIL